MEIYTVDKYEIVDIIPKIDLSRDIVFSFLEDSKEGLNFNFSGGIEYYPGESINFSNIRKGTAAENRFWRTRANFKFSVPSGIHPIFKNPSRNRMVLNTTSNFNQYVNIKVEKTVLFGEELTSNLSVIYQDIDVELLVDKALIMKEYPTLIVPKDFVILEIIPVRTFFNSGQLGNIYIIKNDEFHMKFKESI